MLILQRELGFESFSHEALRERVNKPAGFSSPLGCKGPVLECLLFQTVRADSGKKAFSCYPPPDPFECSFCAVLMAWLQEFAWVGRNVALGEGPARRQKQSHLNAVSVNVVVSRAQGCYCRRRLQLDSDEVRLSSVWPTPLPSPNLNSFEL